MFRLDRRSPLPSPPSFPVFQGSAVSTVACALFFFPQKRRTKSRTKALFFAATSFRSFPNSAIAETASGSANAACFRLSTDISPHPCSRFFQLLSQRAAPPFGRIHPVGPLQTQARGDAHAAFLTKQTAACLPPGRLAGSLTGRRGFTGQKKRMANGHSLIPQFLPTPRRRQPISSKTGPTAPPASRHSQRKRLQVAPAQQPTRRLRRKFFRRGPPSASKGERKQGTGQETARENREWGMSDGEGRRETIQETRPRDRANPPPKRNARGKALQRPGRLRPGSAKKASKRRPPAPAFHIPNMNCSLSIEADRIADLS